MRRNFLLNQQHQALIRGSTGRSKRPTKRSNSGPVMLYGMLPHHLGWAMLHITQLRQRQHIATLQLKARFSSKALLQAFDEIAVQLHSLH